MGSFPARNVTRAVVTAAAVQTAVVSYWITTGATVIAIGLELLAAMICGFTALVMRYRRIVRELHLRTIAEAAANERARIANDMHDTLGHQLSLIALRASALQVQAADSVAQLAAEVRRDADAATAHLHHIIELLRPEDIPSIAAIVEHARGAGMDVTVRGSPDEIDDPRIAYLVQFVVREGLTNAMRHAPGQHADVEFVRNDATVTVSVRTAVITESVSSSKPIRRPMGVRILDDRIRAAGGTVRAEQVAGTFELTATLPHIAQTTGSSVQRYRHPLGVLISRTTVPVLTATALVLAFYASASHGAVMEQSTYDNIAVGAPETSVATELPNRQAPVRLIETDSHPTTWLCRYYTDGNFPLAIATFELCTDNGIVTWTTDLRNRPWN